MSFGGFGIAAETTPAMAPRIVGSLRIGSVVRAIYEPASSWQWRVADDAEGTNEDDIAGAISQTYEIAIGSVLVGQFIQVVVDGDKSSAWRGPIRTRTAAHRNRLLILR